MKDYPLSPQGVFATLQGEGVMLGTPMVFIRLAGCSIGCPECDTDYRVTSRAAASEIARNVVEAASSGCEWVWITGGEPTTYDLAPLIAEVRRAGFRVALATAGTVPIQCGRVRGGPDFLSVSPHSASTWVQKAGDQLNIVPGLNGLRLEDVAASLNQFEGRFTHRYVTPCDGKPETFAECLQWIHSRPGWRLGFQAHKAWGLP